MTVGDIGGRGARIGFIGAGRLGKALAWSLDQAGLPVIAVASRFPEEARQLARRTAAASVMSAQQVVDRCDLVFVTTPDAAIESTTAALSWRSGVAAVHCSGVTEVGALASAAAQGAAIGGFHPMQTFGDPHAAVASLPGSTITIEADDAALRLLLVDLAERLQCRVNRLPAGARARYHAAAGFTSQFVNALLAETARVWASWGASEEDALRAALPLVRGTLASIESLGIAGGMPGPVSRGDVASVQKHVAALAELGPHTIDFYRTLCSTTIELALRSGAIDRAVAERFEQAIDAR